MRSRAGGAVDAVSKELLLLVPPIVILRVAHSSSGLQNLGVIYIPPQNNASDLGISDIWRPFICVRYFWYFWYILPKVPLRSGTFGTFYHFVLLRTFFGEKIATFLRQVAAANAETTKSTAVERYFWYFLPKVPKLPKQMNGLIESTKKQKYYNTLVLCSTMAIVISIA